MAESQLPNSTATSNSGSRLRKWINRHRLVSLVPILVGLSQLLLLFSPAFSERSQYWIIIAGSGWLLISIGFNAFRGKEPLQGDWDSERVRQISAIVGLVSAIFLFIYTIWVSFA